MEQGIGAATGGILALSTPDQVVQQERDHARKEADARQAQPLITGLASYVRQCWQAALEAKQPIEREMLDALNRRAGEYDADKIAAIQEQGGSTIYMMLTDEKCTGAEAWLRELLRPPDGKPWQTTPTPIPDIPPEISQMLKQAIQREVLEEMQMGFIVSPESIQQRMEQAAMELTNRLKERAKKHDEHFEQRVDDKLRDSGWADALDDVIHDIVTFPAAIMKGPVVRRKKTMQWVQSPQGAVPQYQESEVEEFDRVDPFNYYPAPLSSGPQDGYQFERHRLRDGDVYNLIGTKGYDEGAIRSVLSAAQHSGLQDWLWTSVDGQLNTALKKGDKWRDPEGRIDALQFWGTVTGHMLKSYGMSEREIGDLDASYPVEVWIIDRWVIKAEINPHPLGKTPYFVDSFRKRPGAFWGYGLPTILKDIQDVCNATARALVNNMGISSGPQVGVDIGVLPDGEKLTELFPWKIHQFDMTGNNTTRPPLWFFQPTSNANELLKVYQHFSNEADNKSGIPRYAMGGVSKGGATDTASGLSMMLSNAARGIKSVVQGIDAHIIEPSIQALIDHILIYDPDPNYRGDARVIARGATSLLAKEQRQVRLIELLQLVFSSPVGLQIVGMDGGAELLKEAVRGMDVGVEDIFPSRHELQKKEFLMNMMQQGQFPGQAPPEKQPQTDHAGAVAGGRDANQFQGARG